MPISVDEKAAALASLPLFQGASDESLARLCNVTGEVEYSAGQFVVRQGQVGSGLYLIVSGAARVVSGSHELATLGPGDFFGELTVIDQQPRTASVQATQDTVCLAVASWDLLDLLKSDSALALNLIRGLAARVRSNAEHHRH
ncbi:MAG TPA: cyclic nucleotide-binding domain-containing protein [Candidatus Limnocylindria bacterium]|nr:cyclic nucleotide-binding domain-containing protein [Candidatus Limnocylindria bacterium]